MIKNILLSIACLTLCLSNVTAQSFKEKVQFKVNKKKNQLAIDGNHKAHMGEIVFSNQRITFKDANDDLFITSTRLDQPLFLRQYWDKTMEMAYKEDFKGKAYEHAALLYEIKINGQPVKSYVDFSNTGKENAMTWYTTWADISVPRRNEIRGHIYSDLLNDCLVQNRSKLQGKKELEFTSYIYDSASKKKGMQMASGSIVIDFSGQDLSSLVSSANASTPSCMHKPMMDDPALADKLLDATRAKGWEEEHVLAVINTRDYTILRHAISGVIEGRTVGAAVAARKGKKCFYQRFTYVQNYDGSQFTGNWIMDGIGGQESIPCSCLANF